MHKTLVAELASVWLLSAVLHPNVNVQDVPVELLLSALRTLEGLDARVAQHVQIKVALVGEFLAAMVTDVDLLAYVCFSFFLRRFEKVGVVVFGR